MRKEVFKSKEYQKKAREINVKKEVSKRREMLWETFVNTLRANNFIVFYST